MKQLILFASCIFSLATITQSRAQTDPHATPLIEKHFSGGTATANSHLPAAIQGTPIPLPGTVPIGLEGNYQGQFANRGLHNIIVDPDHPQTLHAAIQFATDVTEADTVAGKGFLPQLRVYYLFSDDDGNTWSTPKPIDTARTSNHEMILYKRGSVWVPAIAAVREVADTNAPYFCSLYIEQGNPGDGNFKEFRTDRKTFRDSLRNIDYPSIAVSHDGTKIFMTAGINNNDRKNPQYIQFGTFTLSEDQKTATWGGWAAGPNSGKIGNEDPIGFAYPWSTSVRVSQSGTVGVLWFNRDFQTPDLSTYLSESNDEGKTWLATPKTVVNPLTTATDPYVLVPFQFDFWYAGNTAECALAGFYYNRDSSAGFYQPASGSLLFWKDPMTQPVLILSKNNDTPLATSLLDGTFLSQWTNAQGSPDPQGLSNVNFPTVARTSDPNVFSIYFSAWQDGDVEDVSDLGSLSDPKFTSLPYFSIWRTTTLDGGVNFSGPDMVRGNDLLNTGAQLYDYRQIETAPMNPAKGISTVFHTIFNVDTLAGIMSYGGFPGFDDVTWLFEKTEFSGVPSLQASTSSAIANYPNPFFAQTTLPLILTDAAIVSLEVTDPLGRQISRKNYGKLTPDVHQITFDGGLLHSGTYPYVLSIGDKIARGVFTIVK